MTASAPASGTRACGRRRGGERRRRLQRVRAKRRPRALGRGRGATAQGRERRGGPSWAVQEKKKRAARLGFKASNIFQMSLSLNLRGI